MKLKSLILITLATYVASATVYADPGRTKTQAAALGKQVDETTLGVAGAIVLEAEEAHLEVRKLQPRERVSIRHSDEIRRFLENILLQKVMLVEATEMGLADAAFEQEIAEYRKRLLLSRYKKAKAELTRRMPTEQDLLDYYQSNDANYAGAPQVRVQHILLKASPSDSAEATDHAKGEAERLAALARKGEDFGELARQYSQDPRSATRGGDLGWFPKGHMALAFEEVAFSGLKPGDIAGPVKSPFGYHLIRFVDSVEAKRTPFEEARREIEKRLQHEFERTNYVNQIQELKKKYPFELNDYAIVEFQKVYATPAEPKEQP
jgi:peptidyl-prolyl cis-trans isomerase C